MCLLLLLLLPSAFALAFSEQRKRTNSEQNHHTPALPLSAHWSTPVSSSCTACTPPCTSHGWEAPVPTLVAMWQVHGDRHRRSPQQQAAALAHPVCCPSCTPPPCCPQLCWWASAAARGGAFRREDQKGGGTWRLSCKRLSHTGLTQRASAS